MLYVTPAQMQDIDRYAIETIGIPSVALMENAGRAVAHEVRTRHTRGGRVVICCGSGNNGGDGMVVARHLANHAVPLDLFLITDPARLRGDAKTQFDIVRNMGIPHTPVNDADGVATLARQLADAELVLDAILGTGLSGEVTGVKREVIETINASGRPVIAVDSPSGLAGDTGQVLGVAVRATATVTLQLPKTGFRTAEARRYTGDIVIVDIGIPVQCCPKPVGGPSA